MIARVIFLLLISLHAFSKPGIRFSNLSTKDGLPENVVKSMVQDSQGFIWFATKKGLVKYDGYNITPIFITTDNQPLDVTVLAITNNNQLLIGTKNKGLFSYENGKVEKIKINISSVSNPKRIWSILIEKNRAWIATSTGLFLFDHQNKKLIKNTLFKHMQIRSLAKKSNNELIVLSKASIEILNLDTNISHEITVKSPQANNRFIYTNNDEIWLGRRDGLYKYSNICDCFEFFNEIFEDKIISSILAYKKWLWIGTLYDGLYLYNSKSKRIYHYSYNALIDEYLSDANIISMFIDSNNILWIGTFRAGVDYVNLISLEFGMSTQKANPITCSKSHVIYDMFEQNNETVWFATDKGLVEINSKTNTCQLYNHVKNDVQSLSSDVIRSVYIDKKKDNVWLGTSLGLNQMNLKTKKIKKINEIPAITFISEYSDQQLLLGSLSGLYIFDTKSKKTKNIKYISGIQSTDRFNDFSRNEKNDYVFATYQGLYRLTNKLELEKIKLDENQLPDNFMSSAIYENNKGEIWFGANYTSLYHLNSTGTLENITKYISEKDIEVASIISDNENLWISSNKGLIKLDTRIMHKTNFDYSDGLQDNEYLVSSYHKSSSGKIYFGGIKGYNAFIPSMINTNFREPISLVSQIKINGKKLKISDKTNAEFEIKDEVNNIKKLVLNHKDKKIDIEFANTDFTDISQNKFAYRLVGLSELWEYTIATNRKAVYTNLPSGNYTFQIKTANKYGIWSSSIKEIEIIVYPAPWFSMFAFIIYIILFMISIWFLIRYKTIASRNKALKLEKIVDQRTQELNRQNKVVNSLLAYKNEVFANVTHEFKTPLALILGPTQQLMKENTLIKHKEQLSMIERNASRLMLMVGQILKLSQAEVNKEVSRVPQAVKPIMMMLFESFKPLVVQQGIEFKLENEVESTINATSECLEIVIGNLLSNALKFTNLGGRISLFTELNNKIVTIGVSDSGCGIESKDLIRIFNRFTRLDQHKDIQGTGIGLAVVKEIVELNNGTVKVSSQWGKGSNFIVQFPISEVESDMKTSNTITAQIVKNTENEITYEQNKSIIKQKRFKNRYSVLIIDDNNDMQTHIGNVLKNKFNCSFASRGRKGISIALQEVPDVIVCDVMMPGIDGYQVTRILRHDSRTSHIPIVLLTALNTKESRIKGWRENIDTYIAKPFDATELIVQLENILTIRKLLQKETSNALNNKTPINSIDLPKLDLKFIDKLKNIISQYYGNEYFQIADLASKMAISERQLQRKLKALINTSPMEMLRDYRLEKATLKLKDGYQVSITSDECGFSSLSYFSRCFKKKYGITPKQYQTLDKKC